MKRCPGCNQFREYFVGNICYVCHRANKRAEEKSGGWKDEQDQIKHGHGVEV